MSEFDERKRPDEPADDSRSFDQEPVQIDVELLSAYLEDPADLDGERRRQIEQALATDPETRQRFDELDVLTSALRDLPAMSAPRSYRLTPDMVGARAPANVVAPDVWYVRHMEKLRWAAAAVALLFVMTVSADLVLNGLGPTTGMDDDDADTSSVMSASPVEDGDRAGAEFDQAEPESGETNSMEAADEPAEDESIESDESEEAAIEEEEEDADGDDAAAPTAEPDASILALDPTPTEGAAEEEAEEAEAAPEADRGSDLALTPTAQDSAIAMQEREQQERNAQRESESSRATWRAVQFGLIIVFAVLLGMILILPRWRKPLG